MCCIATCTFFVVHYQERDLCSSAESHPQRPDHHIRCTEFKIFLLKCFVLFWLTEREVRCWQSAGVSKSDVRLCDLGSLQPALESCRKSFCIESSSNMWCMKTFTAVIQDCINLQQSQCQNVCQKWDLLDWERPCK